MTRRIRADALRKLLSFGALTPLQATHETGWTEDELFDAVEDGVDRGWIAVSPAHGGRPMVLRQVAPIEWHVFKPLQPVSVFALAQPVPHPAPARAYQPSQGASL